ncbi:MAG: GntR family transcriptional regulator [Paenibacillus sp.]|jgi:DNA-binding FadR family transcriptional regulator|nr:GntR family transcriptional regulator [Paenibacillus sp.]
MEQITSEDYMILKNMACEKIKSYILSNQLQPGAKLPTERNLAEVLGVSRTVVREALGMLETLGYIEKTQGKGIFVKEPDLSPLFQEMLLHWSGHEDQGRNIRNFRIILEQAAVEWISKNATSADLNRLYTVIEESEQRPLTIKEFIKHDYRFHRELLSMTDNPLFIQLTDVIHKYFQLIEMKEQYRVNPQEAIAKTNKEHRKIVDCLIAKDRNGAVQTILHHFNKPNY